ncbi:hypothetical protein GCM10027028_60710 [Streptomyces sundarbansensis]
MVLGEGLKGLSFEKSVGGRSGEECSDSPAAVICSASPWGRGVRERADVPDEGTKGLNREGLRV